ncbi:MAG TPA: DUF3108 domain-containing protein [Pyrinomonadaceae bacterium]|nr:DUF3108 domain-containing protein [Pyrinomonadaceae bacterium]
MPRRSLLVATAAAVISIVLSSIALASDTPREHTPEKAPVPAVMPFEPSEQLVYEGEFSKLLLRGIKIAELKFTASRPAAGAQGDGQPQPLLLTTHVESKGWFRKLFGINFTYHVESTVQPDGFHALKTSKIDEQGKRLRTSEAVFDMSTKRVEWTERDPNNQAQPPRVVTAALEGPTQDIVSAVYFLRTQPLTPGQSFNIAISDSGRVYQVPARVVAEKKAMKSVLGKVPVVRIEVDLFGEGRPVEGKGKMNIWVTNDERHVPVKARLSHDMGQLDLTLRSHGRAPQ